MRTSRAPRRPRPIALRSASLSVLFVFCALCGAFATGAFAAPGRHAHDRSSRTARTCRRHKHRRCPALHARKKSHRKHKHIAASGPTHATDGSTTSPGASTPWTVVPPSVAPGSTPGASGSGTPHPGSGGSGALGETPASAGPPHVEVTAEDTEAFRFVLSRPSVPAGQVIVEFVNHGQDEHNLNALEPGGEPVPSGSLPDTAPNAHPSLTLNLRAGSYTFFCSIKDHEAKGMKATLKVE